MGKKIAIVLVIGLILASLFSGKISHQFSLMFYQPKMPLEGLSTGMSRERVYGMKGNPYTCQNSDTICSWNDRGGKRPRLIVSFKDDLVTEISKIHVGSGGKPFDTYEQMIEILGEPDIVALSNRSDFGSYTYLDWGASFNFSENSLVTTTMGDVIWRHIDQGQYFIRGKQICPGGDCPWSDEGELKSEYEDKSYKDFIAAE